MTLNSGIKCALCDGTRRSVCTSPDCPQGAGKGKSHGLAEYCAKFDRHYAVQRVARELWRSRNPHGMTVGMPQVKVPAEVIDFLLTRWKEQP